MTSTTCGICRTACTATLCDQCARRFIASRCPGCRNAVISAQEAPRDQLCPACQTRQLAAQVSDGAWHEIDPLLAARQRVDAAVCLQRHLTVSLPLHRLLDVVDARLRDLHAAVPSQYPPPPAAQLPYTEGVLARARNLDQRPLAIEAFWDGDTTGWFLVLAALMSDGASARPREVDLAVLREGGDFRLFTGEVPPWPEALFASQVGQQIAHEIGVPFYFPSPSEPEDACPRWWEREQGTPCKTCGIPLLQRDTTPWKGTCYPCHLREEHRTKRDELPR